MKIIGVTGGVGAGKSQVLDYIEETGLAVIVKADEVGHQVMEPEGICYPAIVKLFGPNVVRSDGTLDRSAIAGEIFGNEPLREQLNAIVHPAVKTEIRGRIQQEHSKGTKYFVIEAALLIEDKYDEICDELWYIYAGEEIRRERLKKSRGYSDEKIDSIFASQLSEEVFRSHCDVIIDNSGVFSQTKEQIRQRMQSYETM